MKEEGKRSEAKRSVALFETFIH